MKRLPQKLLAVYLVLTTSFYLALKSLVLDELASFASRFDESFERHLKDLTKTSFEARKFVGEKLVSALTKIKQGKLTDPEKFNISYELWDGLIEGDSRFRAAPGFVFDPTPVEDPSLIRWKSDSQNIVRMIRETIAP